MEGLSVARAMVKQSDRYFSAAEGLSQIKQIDDNETQVVRNVGRKIVTGESFSPQEDKIPCPLDFSTGEA